MSDDRIDEGNTGESVSGTNEAPARLSSTKQNGTMRAVIIAIVLIAALVAILQFTGVLKLGSSPTGEEAAVAGSAVARINGEEIPRSELDKRLAQIRATIPEGSPDPTKDAAFELQIVDELINLALLKQLAVDAGYTATDDAVAAEIAQVTELFGSEEALNGQLAAVGLSRTDFEENVRNELLIRQLVEANTEVKNIVVTDAEIEQAYQQSFSGVEEAPALEEARDFIRDQLTQQKTNAVIQAYVDDVRSKANIEILL